MSFVVDGGNYRHTEVPETRTADHIEHDTPPPRAASGPAAQPALQDAARTTETKLAASTAADDNLKSLQALPPRTRHQLRGEIDDAQAAAAQARAEAQRAAAAEAALAKQLLTPAYYQRYVDDMASAHDAEPAKDAVVQQALDSAAAPAAPPPDAVQTALAEAQRAQADYDRAVAGGSPSEAYAEHVITPAWQRAQQAWQAVQDAAEKQIQQAEVLSYLPGADGCNAAALKARAPGDERYQKAIDQADAKVQGRIIAADVARTYRSQGAPAAAARLDELTANVPAAVAREALADARPTLDAIGADLGAQAKQVDHPPYGARGPVPAYQKQVAAYDATVEHLSNAVYAASVAPGSADAVNGAVDAIASHVDPKDIGRLDEALGNAVRHTGAATLAVGVADHLQRAGRSGQADDVLQNVQDGIKGLKEDTAAAAGDLADDKVFRLVSGYSTFVLPGKDPKAALDDYLARHPDDAKDYQKHQDELGRKGAAALRLDVSLQGLPPALADLKHGKGVQKEKADFDKDPVEAFALSTSPQAGAELDRLVAAQGAEGDSFIAKVAEGTELAKGTYEAVGQIYIRSTLNRVYDQVRHNDVAGAEKTLDGLKDKGRLFGVDNAKIDKAVDALKTDLASSQGTLTRGELKDHAETLDKKLTEAGFADDTLVGKSFRAVGVGLSFYGFVESTKDLVHDRTPGAVLQELVSAAGLGKDGFELFKSDSAILEKAGWKAGGAVLAGYGIATDLFAFANHAQKGQWVDGGFDLLSATGGGLGLWAAIGGEAAAGSWAGPVGLGLVALAAAGQLGWAQYQHVQDANRLEDGGTQDYLEALGFNRNVTYHLRDADSDGRSALPTLGALATSAGYDLSKPEDQAAFINYINAFGQRPGGLDQLGRLVEAAHHVQRNEDGSVKTDLTADEKQTEQWSADAGEPALYETEVESIAGLRDWMAAQGIAPPPPAP